MLKNSARRFLLWLGIVCLALLPLNPALADTDNPKVKLTTDLGEIVIELYPALAPVTVANFLGYVNEHFYDGLLFHRVVPNFMIQTGGKRFDFTEKEPKEPIVNESANGLLNKPGTIAMARLPDPDSATSQFYINIADNTHLNPKKDKPGYTVFGKVIDGMDVVKAISVEETGLYKKFPNAPNVPVRILKARTL